MHLHTRPIVDQELLDCLPSKSQHSEPHISGWALVAPLRPIAPIGTGGASSAICLPSTCSAPSRAPSEQGRCEGSKVVVVGGGEYQQGRCFLLFLPQFSGTLPRSFLSTSPERVCAILSLCFISWCSPENPFPQHHLSSASAPFFYPSRPRPGTSSSQNLPSLILWAPAVTRDTEHLGKCSPVRRGPSESHSSVF